MRPFFDWTQGHRKYCIAKYDTNDYLFPTLDTNLVHLEQGNAKLPSLPQQVQASNPIVPLVTVINHEKQ